MEGGLGVRGGVFKGRDGLSLCIFCSERISIGEKVENILVSSMRFLFWKRWGRGDEIMNILRNFILYC